MPALWVRFDIRQAWRRIVTVLVAWLVLNVLLWAFFVRPNISGFQTLEENSHPRIMELKARKSQVEAREAFLLAVKKSEQDLKTLRKVELGDRNRNMVPAQLKLDQLAGKFKVNMSRVQYENSELEEEELDRFAMLMPLEGGYTNLRKFIQAVESADRFLVIERVTLGQGKEGGVLLELNITVATYFDAPHLRNARARAAAARGT